MYTVIENGNALDSNGGEGVVEVLLAVKETRGTKYYQVLSK